MDMSENVKRRYLEFYALRKFHVLPSESLLPSGGDSTLLFVNSVLARFKKEYCGLVDPVDLRLATSQPCLRFAGQSTLRASQDVLRDLNEGRRPTLFEQLGTAVFGVSSRDEAIENIWLLLVEEFGLPPDKIWITLYQDDVATYNSWRGIGFPEDRMVLVGEQHWAYIPDINICGPCTHFIYDRGKKFMYACGKNECGPRCGCGRFVDLGDLIFFENRCDKDKGVVGRLSRLNIDSGLSLERLCMVIENKNTELDISSFQPILSKLSEVSEYIYGTNSEQDAAMRIIADHARAVTFSIGSMILPNSKGRGYVIRKIVRRASQFGNFLGKSQPFLHQLCDVVIDTMADTYPFLADKRAKCREVILDEERRYQGALQNSILEFQKIADSAAVVGSLSGEEIFKLYSTYGMPLELLKTLARARKLTIDETGFNKFLTAERDRSRS